MKKTKFFVTTDTRRGQKTLERSLNLKIKGINTYTAVLPIVEILGVYVDIRVHTSYRGNLKGIEIRKSRSA